MKEETEATIEKVKGVAEDIIVVVSLVRTLTDAFVSVSDLYKRLKHKSRIRFNDGEGLCRDGDRGLPRRRDSGVDHGRTRHLHVRWGHRDDDDHDSDDELICTSSAQIRAEYDRGYRKLGETFARGDFTTQIQLQAQIILLQHTLLDIHEDLLVSTYISPTSSHSHLLRLIQTTRTARSASISALNMQYKRLLSLKPPDVPLCDPEPVEPKPGGHGYHHFFGRPRPWPRRRGSSSSSSSSSASEDDKPEEKPCPAPKPCPPPKPCPTPKPPPPPPNHRLFCVYSRDLQRHDRLPLTDNFECGNNTCPYCRAHIPIRPGKAWEIAVDGDKPFDGQIKMLSRKFLVKRRFVIKSHREGTGFACVLCARFRPSDTTCRHIDALMDHLWRDHTGEELEKDSDIVER